MHPRDAFRKWRAFYCEQLLAVGLHDLSKGPFQGRIDQTTIGSLSVTRTKHSGMRTESTAQQLRQVQRDDTVIAIFGQSGRSICQQGDREAVIGAGDFTVLAPRPIVAEALPSSTLMLSLPRARIEAVLGPSGLFSALTVGASAPSATLAGSYIRDLVRVSDQLTPDSAVRLASIAIDLVIACLAERMAQEPPRSVHSSVVVQRAKAYVEAHLHDQDLDPPRLAAAMGVSLRRLQELFHERGQHISDWIWQRRLTAAAKRLADPAYLHLSIGTLAYGCGFSSQAHFARRFKDHHGMTPREYRMVSALSKSRTMLDL